MSELERKLAAPTWPARTNYTVATGQRDYMARVVVADEPQSDIVATVYGETQQIAFDTAAKIVRACNAHDDLLAAMRLVMDDLDHYAVTHGPGPDKRLEAFRAALAKATK